MDTRNFLELALKEAEKALGTGNFPCGAVLVDRKGNVVVSKYNERHSLNDVTAHAEIQCLRHIDDEKLENNEYSLFCSSEPCGGCAFFIARTKIKKIYWVLNDPQNKGLGDFKKNAETGSFFSGIEIFEEPCPDLKEKSANLFRQYYFKSGNAIKMKLY